MIHSQYLLQMARDVDHQAATAANPDLAQHLRAAALHLRAAAALAVLWRIAASPMTAEGSPFAAHGHAAEDSPREALDAVVSEARAFAQGMAVGPAPTRVRAWKPTP